MAKSQLLLAQSVANNVSAANAKNDKKKDKKKVENSMVDPQKLADSVPQPSINQEIIVSDRRKFQFAFWIDSIEGFCKLMQNKQLVILRYNDIILKANFSCGISVNTIKVDNMI